ncbi:MAG: hypothetical protein GF331_07585 [Chitinivibrionales bacterium]|nr:hypothetical protein [Chitinivibrionales bacterium]
MTEPVQFTSYSHVVRLRLNRPAQGNVVNAQMLGAIQSGLDKALADSECRAIVIEGADGVFCRGMDFAATLAQAGAGLDDTFAEPYGRVVTTIRDASKPVIAAIDGEVLAGGMGLALACDIVLATPRSVFGLSEVLFGLIPAYVFPFLLERMPLKKARFMVLSSQKFSADRAHELGVVDEIAEDLEKTLTQYLKRLLTSSPKALAAVKTYSDRISGEPLPQALSLAAEQLTALLRDTQTQSAIRAFLDGDKLAWAVKYRRPHRDD